MPASKTPTITYFFRFFKKYHGLIIAGFFFLIIARVAATAQPIFLRNIINDLTYHTAYRAIIITLIIYFVVYLAGIIFEYLRDYFFSPVIMGVSRDIEKTVFNHLLKLPVSYHADQKAGAAARAVARGSRAITFVLDFMVSQLLPPVFQLIFVTVLLLRLYSWQYGVITLVTIIFYTWFTIWSTEKRQVYRLRANQKDDESGGILIDAIGNIDVVKYFNNENILFNIFSKIKEIWYRLLVKNNRLFAAIYGGQGLILLVGLGLILLLAVRQTFSGIIGVGDLILLTTYIVQLSGPITTLGFVYGNFKNSFADLEAMAGILNQPVTIEEPANPVDIKKPQGAVEFRNVFFDYAERKNVINNLSLKILPGRKAAFVGPSGAGKSTIAKLFFRLYDTTAGHICLDGTSIKKLSSKTRREIMAIVPQEPGLFNDTIANNIKFSQPDASQKEIESAAQAAQIHDFIMRLPEKYNTLVGERGIKLSGGEKQRVAIARAILKNPKVLIFDEATSNLDSANEQAILQTINKVAIGRTTISIAHRLSTIVNSDVIYVLDCGKIVEQGTHEQLLQLDGVYAKLWQIQSRSGKNEA